MRYLLVLVLLCGFVLAGYAQTAPVEPTVASYSYGLRAASPDTIRAIRRLYATRRSRGSIIAFSGVTACLAAGVAWDNSETRPDRAWMPPPSVYTVLGGLAALLPGLWGGIMAADFSAQQEDNMVRRYQAGEPLPDYIRRKLQPEYFGR